MTYDICDNRDSGETIFLVEDLTEQDAMAQAAELAKSKKGITVEWNRASDGQHGYLNQDGNHAINGQYWT